MKNLVAISINNTNNINISEIKFSDYSTSISFNNSNNSKVENNIINTNSSNKRSSGIIYTNSSNATFKNNTLYDNGTYQYI